jgi:hypothetical protein
MLKIKNRGGVKMAERGARQSTGLWPWEAKCMCWTVGGNLSYRKNIFLAIRAFVFVLKQNSELRTWQEFLCCLLK